MFAYAVKDQLGAQSTTARVRIVVVAFPEVLGCTDPLAANYNPHATKDDGSCAYATCTPGVTEALTFCWDGSVENYRTCKADGSGWELFSNTCPIQEVLGCTDPI